MVGKSFLIKLHWLLTTQLGFDPRTLLRSVRGSGRFARDWRRFRSQYAGRLGFKPCLHDWYDESGAVHSEYFWQDLLVARQIFDRNPQKHVDVGSRVDGFVAHVASFREIEVFDVRPANVRVPGVRFRQVDLMHPPANIGDEYCDSLSCLHALEHFGLGRYGDPVDANGYRQGLANLARLLCPGGRLYLSTPIGEERVEFNANRVFDPRTILACALDHGLVLRQLTVLRGDDLHEVEPTEPALVELAATPYALGLFIFAKGAEIEKAG